MSQWKWIVLLVGLLVVVGPVQAGQNPPQIMKEVVQAYLFGYPLVLMDTTMRSHTNPDHKGTPLNHFRHNGYFPDHNFRTVVKPNNDTLYSNAWLDLTGEPLVLSVPDTAGRYYVMPFMDAWTNVFASVGKRTTGTGPGHYLLAGPDWRGEVPPNTSLIRAPTNMVWLIGRIQTNTEADFENVFRLQEQFTLTPLSRWGTGKANQSFILRSPSGQATDNPSAMVEEMPADRFFSRLCTLMGKYPPAAADKPMLERLALLGIVPGEAFDMSTLEPSQRSSLEKSVELIRKQLNAMSKKRPTPENNWAVSRRGIGVYGINYPIRAFVALIGLGALPPEEAAYPNSHKDKEGRPLSGEYAYRIHFEAGKAPPVDAFWSLTVYDENNFLTKNPIHRYTIGDRDDLRFNSDGSLDILIQHRQPASGISNWLPAPDGSFNVTMRLYMPKAEFLDGTWRVPPIERMK